VEQAAASDGLELAVVTDEGEPPVALVGEGDESGERAGADHAGFIDLCGRPHKLNLCRHRDYADTAASARSDAVFLRACEVDGCRAWSA